MPLSKENELAHRIIGYAIEIHKTLGPGLPPGAYRECLLYELANSGMECESMKKMPLAYKTIVLEDGLSIDILVEDKVVVLIENAENIADFHVQKLLRFLRVGGYKLGLLINFNSMLLKDGIRRVTNNKLLEKEAHKLNNTESVHY